MESLTELYFRPKQFIAARQATTVIEQLRRRGTDALFFDTPVEAVHHVETMIPPGAVVGLGGSVSVTQSGLLDALRHMPIELLDRYRDGLTPADQDVLRKRALTADVFVMGCNAITADGRLVNMDGYGTRVGPLISGPARVILLAGINKVVPTLDEAFSRIKNVAAPLNAVRLGYDTPCARSGFCDDAACVPPQRLCSQLTVIESNRLTGRLTVILVGQDLGF